ncbi:uncharacterized protein LOC101240834 [Hydra vulgaris]|uniref:uncharacterized protein LOC101240834 n=1 Tax=Hydra vulgaris TaxID=6087 RepID=UPI0032EA3878
MSSQNTEGDEEVSEFFRNVQEISEKELSSSEVMDKLKTLEDSVGLILQQLKKLEKSNEAPTGSISTAPLANISEAPTGSASKAPLAVVSAAPLANISEAPTGSASKAPLAVVSAPLAVISEAPLASVSATHSSVATASWESFLLYRSQHPGPFSQRAFFRWCQYGGDDPSFRWRRQTPYGATVSNYLGEMNHICQYCGAKKFLNETHFLCCHSGKVALAPLSPYPLLMHNLMTGNHVDRAMNQNFFKHIRSYNAFLSFASFTARIAPPSDHGPPCFRICGQIVHRVGNLRPDQNVLPAYCQLYVYDPNTALNFRMEQNDCCIRELMEFLQTIISQENPFALAFKNMAEIEDEEVRQAALEGRPTSIVKMSLLEGGDRRRYNLPSHEEVAIVFVGDDGAPPPSREVVIYPRGQALKTISSMSANLDPMIYPIFFPRGDAGWHEQLEHHPDRATRVRNRYAVDAYVKIEGQRLAFIRNNQNRLRSEQYDTLYEHVNNAANNLNVRPGRVVILPSSYVGSPRALKENFEDAMAIIKRYGKPDLFITFTCNPKWKEITENLNPGESPSDRPDLVCRVFKMKLKCFLDDIFKHGVLGKVISHVQVIEFQKRGLPHVHILLHFVNDDKLETAEDIDSLISAEIPDQTVDPELFEIIKTCMIHGPCGILNPNSSCMKDGICTKKFPKEFNPHTDATFNGYPHYRRLDNGRVVVIKGNQVDNRWVVPYNPWLSKKYQAHINVEACMSIKSVKYLYKYVYKGHDCAHVLINESLDHDEINTYLDCRFVSAPEALWRIFEYSISDMSHTIIRLQVHLPDNQRVYFNEGEERVAIDRAAQRDTHLTAWFKLNAEINEARQYSYVEIPYHFVFDGKNCKWKVRQRGSDKVIVRMYKVNLTSEVFFLRLLLLHVKGAMSFENLRTIHGTVFNTFREACYRLGLLQDDIEWRNTLTEAVATRMPKQIRQLFSIILTLCEPDDHLHLWNTFKDYMIEDYIHHSMPVVLAEQTALRQIESIINQSGKTLTDYNLPTLDQLLDNVLENDDGDIQVFIDEANRVRPLLNDNQRNVADAILAALSEEPNNENKHSRFFFMDRPAGCGKTFTYNYLIAETRSRHIRTATAAWTGIAATLLKNGCTLHGLFKLPVPILETSTCNVTPNSIHGRFLRQVSLYLLDEASMIPKHALSAIDKLLQDICNNKFPFGGKVILMGGDFRQILPVVKRGRPADVVESCIKCSEHWQYVQRFSLTENMRVQIGEEEFSQWLLKLGSGTLPVKPEDPLQGCIEIPEQCFLNDNESIVEKIFGGAEEADYAKRAILTPTNVDSLAINEEVLHRLPGDVKTYLSSDSIETDDHNEIYNFPVEFLNTLTPSGMPVHCLKLKIGAVIMLLRNLDLKGGLCNGTRLIVRALHNNYIDGEVLTGVSAGNTVFVPRVQLAPSDSNLPFTLKRRQFPVRLAYSMTINKSQGQTFDKFVF